MNWDAKKAHGRCSHSSKLVCFIILHTVHYAFDKEVWQVLTSLTIIFLILMTEMFDS